MQQENLDTLAAYVEGENALIRKGILEYHAYLIEGGDEDVPADPEDYLSESLNMFVELGPPVEPAAVTQFEQTIGRTLCASARVFYEKCGTLVGSFNGDELSIALRSPMALLSNLADTSPPYERLMGFGLHDMMQFCWGHRDDLKAGEGCSQEEIDALNRHICLGWAGDGFCEAHIYIYETADDLYRLYHWHQDEELPEVAESGGMPLDQLICKMLDVYSTLRIAEDDEDGFFSVGMLADAVAKSSY